MSHTKSNCLILAKSKNAPFWYRIRTTCEALHAAFTVDVFFSSERIPLTFVILNVQARGLAVNLGNIFNYTTRHPLCYITLYLWTIKSASVLVQSNISNYWRYDMKINKHFNDWKYGSTLECKEQRPGIISNKTTFVVLMNDKETRYKEETVRSEICGVTRAHEIDNFSSLMTVINSAGSRNSNE